MARSDALLRLRKTLLARRAELGKRLAVESNNLHNFDALNSIGDSADAAFERESDEMSGQLQDLEARELSQIEHALARLKQGGYGACAKCQKQIPLARLNALPYAPLCITCERARETCSEGPNRPDGDNWAQLADSEAGTGDQRISLAEMERN
jgi:DnaK suppressor protein